MAGNATHRGEDSLVLDATGMVCSSTILSRSAWRGIMRVTDAPGDERQTVDEHEARHPQRCQWASRGVHERYRASVMTPSRMSKPSAVILAERSGVLAQLLHGSCSVSLQTEPDRCSKMSPLAL